MCYALNVLRVKLRFHTSTVGPLSSSLGPNVTVLSSPTEGQTLDQTGVHTETLSSRVPQQKQTAFSTNCSSHSEAMTDAQSGNVSSDVDSDSVPHSSATTDSSFNSDTGLERDYPQINTNTGNQEQRKRQWIW